MLKSVFQPFTLKDRTVKNRFTVPAMVTNYCNEDGTATERYLAYHEKRAKGGFGLIITEDYAVEPAGRGFKYVAGLWNDEQIEGHKELPKRVHAHGATILAQIYHAGRQTSKAVTGLQPVAPSPIPCPFSPDVPKELTIQEIQDIVTKFADTAYRAKECGFDGVEIHGGHGYLIAEFMSTYANKRVDEYGGNISNRLRFPIAIIKAIRERCGNDFIIGFRISADEFIEGGRTIEETKVVAAMLEQAGIDLIHISAGVYASADTVVPPSSVRQGWITDLAAEVKRYVTIPVIAVGRINDPFVADSVIVSDKADFVAMGRASLIDPCLPRKAKDQKYEDIRKCIGCNFGCLGILFVNEPIKCVINPELGNECRPCESTATPKKIAIVGAGPAGLTAAIFAKKVGHDVTVFEKNDRAGGQLYFAAIPPAKGDISDFVVWQTTQLQKLNIPIHYNTTVTADFFKDKGFDEIVVATGAKGNMPPIKGSELPHVSTAVPVLIGKINVGANVVVIGGGQVGAETALHLASYLRNVTVVEATPAIAAEEAMAPRWHLLRALDNRKVNVLTNTEVVEIKEGSVVIKTANGEQTIPADNVIVAVGAVSDNALAEELKAVGYNCKLVGDVDKVANVLTATKAGFDLAMEI